MDLRPIDGLPQTRKGKVTTELPMPPDLQPEHGPSGVENPGVGVDGQGRRLSSHMTGLVARRSVRDLTATTVRGSAH